MESTALLSDLTTQCNNLITPYPLSYINLFAKSASDIPQASSDNGVWAPRAYYRDLMQGPKFLMIHPNEQLTTVETAKLSCFYILSSSLQKLSTTVHLPPSLYR